MFGLYSSDSRRIVYCGQQVRAILGLDGRFSIRTRWSKRLLGVGGLTDRRNLLNDANHDLSYLDKTLKVSYSTIQTLGSWIYNTCGDICEASTKSHQRFIRISQEMSCGLTAIFLGRRSLAPTSRGSTISAGGGAVPVRCEQAWCAHLIIAIIAVVKALSHLETSLMRRL